MWNVWEGMIKMKCSICNKEIERDEIDTESWSGLRIPLPFGLKIKLKTWSHSYTCIWCRKKQ
jgi:lysophospholipid acyltransferase (LPLAT)-like uncharacterized protein